MDRQSWNAIEQVCDSEDVGSPFCGLISLESIGSVCLSPVSSGPRWHGQLGAQLHGRTPSHDLLRETWLYITRVHLIHLYNYVHLLPFRPPHIQLRSFNNLDCRIREIGALGREGGANQAPLVAINDDNACSSTMTFLPSPPRTACPAIHPPKVSGHD